MRHQLANEASGTTLSPATLEPISMRIGDACRFTGLSRSTLYVLISSGRIKIAKVGRSTLVMTSSLKSLLSEATADRA